MSRPAVNKLKHNIDDPLSDTSPFQWRAVSDEEFFSAVQPNIKREDVLPIDHLAHKRIQFWIDQIDSMLRQKYGDIFQQVPRPTAKIVISNETLAVVPNVEICLDFNVKIKGAPDGSDKIETISFDRSFNYFEPRDADAKCVKSEYPRDKQKELIGWQFKFLTGCSYTIDETSVNLNLDCFQEEVPQISAAEKLVVYASSDQIVFFSKMLEGLTEDEAIAFIAHELAHYYKAHFVTEKGQYNFAYRVGSKNLGEKPHPDENLEKLISRLRDRMDSVLDIELAEVPGQKYSSAIYEIIGSLDPLCRNEGGQCQTPCQKLKKKMVLPDFPV
jgi:hypothetical protein